MHRQKQLIHFILEHGGAVNTTTLQSLVAPAGRTSVVSAALNRAVESGRLLAAKKDGEQWYWYGRGWKKHEPTTDEVAALKRAAEKHPRASTFWVLPGGGRK